MNATPRRLGKYELQQLLGRGSVGEVWKGYDYQAKSTIAIKLLHPDLQADPHFMSRFMEDGEKLRSLQHPNLVHVREVATARDESTGGVTPYIVTDYIEGQNLGQYIQQTSRRGRFPDVADIVYIFTSLGIAIDYASEHGVLHGNIKPANILLNQQATEHTQLGEPMLNDMSIATLLDHPVNTSAPYYLSPEQAKGQEITLRSDIYSLGVILYEMCTGVLPFHGDSSIAVMMHHINTLPTPPILINPNIPPALSEVILRAMAKEPASRYAMASLFAAAIADACAVTPTLNKTQQSRGEELRPGSTSGAKRPAGMAILGVPEPEPRISEPLPPISQPLRRVTAKTPALTQKQPAIQPSNSGPLAAKTPPSPLTSGPLGQGKSAAATSGQLPPTTPTSGPLPTGKIPTISSGPLPTSGPLSGKHTAAFPAMTNKMSAIPPTEKTASQKIQAYPPQMPLSPARENTAARLPAYMPPTSTPPPAMVTPQTFPFFRKSSQSPILIAIISLLLLLLVVGTMAIALWNHNQSPQATTAPDTILGHVFFQDDALGHNDVLRIDLTNVPPPDSGKQYYGWLDNIAGQSVLLGTFTNQNGKMTLMYPGDSNHTNLLTIIQSIFVTEQDANGTPQIPTGKVYQASFAPASVQYLKNLLNERSDLPMKTSLITSLFESVKQLNDKADSILDTLQNTHQYPLAQRQAIRILEIIDGTQYAYSSGDMPKGLPSQLSIPIGIISSPTTKGYIDLVADQIDNIKQNAGNNTDLLHHANNVSNALSDLRTWIEQLRDNDIKLLKAPSLADPALISVAQQVNQESNDAYTGKIIPPDTSPQPTLGSAGALQAYVESQYMATMNISKV